MICPYCGGSTFVTNSRSHNHNQAVWRRRSCKQCRAVWTTSEQYELTSTHQVFHDGVASPEPFIRDVLFVSIKDSLSHRKTAVIDASALTDTIITKVLALKTARIDTAQLKQLAYETLQAFDATAAAVYQASREA